MFYTVSKLSNEPESTLSQWGSPVRNFINNSCPFGFMSKILENLFPFRLVALPYRLYTLRETKIWFKAYMYLCW